MRLKKNHDISFLGLFFLCAFFSISPHTLFSQDNESDVYQQILIKALASGTFIKDAHSVLDKLQNIESYERLLLRILATTSIKQDQKKTILLEILSLYELLDRWSDIPGICQQLIEIEPQNTMYTLKYCISLIVSGESEKATQLLKKLPSDTLEFQEYKTILSMWIQFSNDYKKLNEQEIFMLANASNPIVRISSLQLLILISSGTNQEKYTTMLKTYTDMDYSYFSAIYRYMLSMSFILSKTPISVTNIEKDLTQTADAVINSIIIQTGAFSKYDNAKRLQEQLEKLGYSVKIVQRTTDGIYLVLVYSKSSEYQSIILQLKDMGIEAWLVND